MMRKLPPPLLPLVLSSALFLFFSMFSTLYTSLLGVVLVSTATVVSGHPPDGNHHSPNRRCAYGDDCWPDAATWSTFNTSVSGRLIASYPSAAVCHKEQYDAGLCKNATAEWANSFWRTSQVGAYSALLWELGSDQCFINTTIDEPCGPGLGM
jgi:hypothetical protein